MTICTKLCGTVGTLAAMGLLVSGAGAYYVSKLNAELTVATQSTAIKLDLSNASRARAWEMISALRGMYVYGVAKNRPEFEASERRWTAAYKRSGEQVAQIRPLLTTDEGRQQLARFETALADFGSLSSEYIRLCKDGKFDEVPALLPRVKTFEKVSEESLDFIKVRSREFLKDSQDRAASLHTQSMLMSILASCLLLLVTGLAAPVVIGIKRLLSRMVRDLSDGADQVASAASQVSAASQTLAQGASEEAASLEETSASSAEISSMARSNADHAATAASLVTASQKKFDQTNKALEDTIEAMREINAQSGKISKIIRTIDEIAFQTNILALNAAVEAARAGEYGTGFAVVADEVRSLAQRCAQAARDTTSLIEESVGKSDRGQSQVDAVAIGIREITGESAKIKALVDDVNQGSVEQARGVEQIGKAMSQMEQITQQTAASAEEGAAAAQQLNAQSEALRQIVNHLSELVDGTVLEDAVDSDGRRPGRSAGRPSSVRAGLAKMNKAVTPTAAW